MDDIAGCLHSTLINGLKRALRTFKFNYNDMENAPLWLYAPPVDPDGKLRVIPTYKRIADELASLVTFLKVSLTSVTLTMPVDVYALQLCAQQILLRTNDLASSEYASALSLAIPCIVARVLERKKSNNVTGGILDRIAYLRTSLFLDRLNAPAQWKQERLRQQRFVRAQDQQSGRCGPLYGQPAPTSQSSSLLPRSTRTHALTAPYYNGTLYCPSPFENLLGTDGE